MRFYFLLLLSMAGHYAKSQTTDSLIARIITNYRNLYELNPTEKCFLHLDKDFYQPGETIFFKTYITLYNSFTTLSKVVYTDLTDVNGNLYHKAMWRSEGGVSNGSIFLPDTLSTGIYRVRGYTMWMLNQKHTIGEQYVFVQGKKDQAKSFQIISKEIHASFFPEGGKLVHGVPCRMAYRLTDENRLPLHNTIASLTDEAGTEITKPVIHQSGAGLIEFTPNSNKKYYLAVTNGQTTKNFPLPSIALDAITVKVDNLSASKLFVQSNASDQFKNQSPIVYVLLQQNGTTVSVQKFDLNEDQNATVINKKNLSTGLLQILVLNGKIEPVANRWIWVTKPQIGSLQLDSKKISFEQKAKNELVLTFKGVDTPSLSVSVIPADLPTYNFLNVSSIEAYSMIHSNNTNEPFVTKYSNESDLENDSKITDVLTMTINPSIVDFKQIVSGTQPPLSYFFETGLSIRGFVKKDRDKMEFDSSKIDIIIKSADSSTIFSTSKMDSRGAFAVNNLDFKKNATVSGLATSKDKKRRKIEFQLLPSYIDTLSDKIQQSFFNPAFIATTLQPANESFIKFYSVPGIGKELKEIVISGKNRQERYIDSLNKVMASDNFRNSEFTKVPDTNFNYISFDQMFQQEFFGFRFNSGYDRISGMDGSAASGLAGNDVISYYLNEMPIDVSELKFINPADVVLIKVNRNANLHLGLMGPGPSILIYTKNKGLKSKFGLTTSTISGYSIPLQFKNPDYTVDSLRSEDRRTTLLWIPNLKFEPNGTSKLTFFNNTYTKRFRVVIQGIDAKGQMYHVEKIIE